MNKTSTYKSDISEKCVLRVVIISILVVGVLRVMTHASLFADGSYWLVFNIQNDAPILTGGRTFVEFIAQVPVQLAVQSNLISNTYVLSILFGIGMHLLPTFNFATSVYILRNQISETLPFLSSIVLCFMFSGSVGQSSLGISTAAVCYSLLVGKNKICLKYRLLLLIYSCILINSYESTAIFALIFLLIVMKSLRSSLEIFGLKLSIALIIIYLAAAINAWRWIVNPYAGSSNRDSILYLGNLLNYPNFDKLTLFLIASVLISLTRNIQFFTLFLGVIMLVSLLPSNTLSLGLLYQTRGFATILVAIGMAALFWPKGKLTKRLLGTGLREIFLKSLLAFALIGVSTNMATQNSWTKFLYSFKQQLSMDNTNPVPFESLKTSEEVRLNGWAWTNPSLSLIVRATAKSSIIANPTWYEGWDPKVEYVGLPDRYIWVER